MEMMDMRAAATALENCRVALIGIGKIVLQNLEVSQNIPEIEERRISLQRSLKELWRNCSLTSMAVSEQIIIERKLLLNHPDELADLIVASKGLQVEMEETNRTLRKFDPTFPQAKTEKQEKP